MKQQDTLTTLVFTAILVLGCVPALLCAASAEEKGFRPLFNGKDLAGWYGDVNGWQAKDGLMVCDEAGTIWTEEVFDNFILRFEFMLMAPGANNGLGVRLPRGGFAAYDGMEIQIWDDASAPEGTGDYQLTGAVYGIAAVKPGHVKPVGQWNYEEFIANGRQITVRLNGVTVLDVDLDEASKLGFPDGLDARHHPGSERTKGCLCFQGHPNIDNNHVNFRNIRIKKIENPRPPKPENAGFVPLYNGRDLSGWRLPESEDQTPQDRWHVDDRGLVCGADPIYSDKPFRDFVLRFQFKQSEGAQSRLLLRDVDSPETAAAQIQLGNDKDHRHGSLLGVATAQAGPLKPFGNWNYQEVVVRGDRLTVELNGKAILDTTLARCSRIVGLAGHGGRPENRTEFCNIRIKSLK